MSFEVVVLPVAEISPDEHSHGAQVNWVRHGAWLNYIDHRVRAWSRPKSDSYRSFGTWHAAYTDARERGSTAELASEAAGRYMAEVKNILV